MDGPDARKTLPQLQQEWASCNKCALGERRLAVEGQFVFGHGTTDVTFTKNDKTMYVTEGRVAGGMMFIGEGPGSDEEKIGMPFVGRSGRILRRALKGLGLREYYVTNIVACRSCVAATNADGTPFLRKNRQTNQVEQVFRDESPTPVQYNACLPRLHEEIYLVDPVVIVGLGNKACEVLLRRPVTITKERGEGTQIAISGAGWKPVLTEKKQEWRRKIGGVVSMPVERNEVLYHFMPTIHPAFVAREILDNGVHAPLHQFITDLHKAIRTYESYLEIVLGQSPSYQSDDISTSLYDEIRNDQE